MRAEQLRALQTRQQFCASEPTHALITWLEIVGGVALTVFGARFLRKGLDRLFGGKLAAWLAALTENRWKAFAAGAGVGTVAPSSTAIAMMTVQMLHEGKIGPDRMLAVLVGANVGITITIQLIAFHVQDYAALLIVLGVFGFQFLRRDLHRGIGQCVLSLGFVFLAMRMIGEGAAAVSGNAELREALRLLQGHPWLVLISTTILAVMLQSSTASIGLGIGLVIGGMLTPALIVPWVVGTNVGLGITSLATGWASPEGRRLGLSNLLVKCGVALPLLIAFDWTVARFEALPGDAPRQVALFHTGFNVIAAAIALPFATGITRIAGKLLGRPAFAPGGSLAKPTTYLDPGALETPSLALAQATRETMLMGDEIKAMLGHFWRAEVDHDADLARRLQQQDDRIDAFNRDIKDYLSHLREGITQAEAQWQFTLLAFVNELEAVGDIIDKNLCDALVKQHSDGARFPIPEQEAVRALFERVTGRLDLAIALLSTRDPEQARQLVAGKEALNDWCRLLQKEHYDRLRAGDRATMSASTFFLEMLNSLRRINSHLTAIGYALQPAAKTGHGHGPAPAKKTTPPRSHS